MVLEAWHTNRKGEPTDLTNGINGEVVFPFSNGSILRWVFNSTEEIDEEDTLADEFNVEGEVYTSFFKLNEWKVVGFTIPKHALPMLYMLKVIRHKYLIIQNKRVAIKDVIINKEVDGRYSCAVSLQLLLSETSITGNR